MLGMKALREVDATDALAIAITHANAVIARRGGAR
jgi:Holliday junction resolvasome RuvABC endonuclease subunit